MPALDNAVSEVGSSANATNLNRRLVQMALLGASEEKLKEVQMNVLARSAEVPQQFPSADMGSAPEAQSPKPAGNTLDSGKSR